MKTSIDKLSKQYIIDHIDNSNYSDEYLAGNFQKVKFLHDTFYSEYGWAVERMGEHKALIEWFQGLPSACNIAFYNSDILNLAVEWGSLQTDATERQQQKILDNWWNLLAAKTGQLFRKYRFPETKL